MAPVQPSASTVIAVDARTGARHWMVDAAQVAGQAATGGFVVLTEIVESRSAPVVRALDQETGREEWRLELGGPAAAIGSPVMSSGRVIVDVAYGHTSHSALIAVDVPTGRIAWRYETPDLLFGPVVDDDLAYVVLANSDTIAAIDLADGREVWRSPGPPGMASSPAASSGVLFVGSANGEMATLDAGRGTPVWHAQTGDEVTEDFLAGENGVLYTVGRPRVALGLRGMALRALDSDTGSQLWHVERESIGSIIESEGRPVVFLGSFSDQSGSLVEAFDASSGRRLWAEPGTFALPAGNHLLMVRDDHTLLSLDAATGSERWSRRLPGGVSAPMTASEQSVYLAIEGGLVSFDLDTGRIHWEIALQGSLLEAPVVLGSIVLAVVTPTPNG